jgi:hypothetical protein
MAAENATLAAKDTAPYLKDGGLELDRVRTEQDRGISIVVPQILWKSVPGDLVGWKTVACEPACRYKFREEVFSRKMGGWEARGRSCCSSPPQVDKRPPKPIRRARKIK